MDKPSPKHFDGKRFFNPGAPQARGPSDVFRWKLTSRPERSPRFISDAEQSIPSPGLMKGELRVTLINHSTVLLQQSDSNILTDPIWSERASPFSWAGPRRHRAPGIRMEDLPRIDIVLISHNHYDHLDLQTLKWLSQRGDPIFIVPLGVAPLLRSQKIERVMEFEWDESRALGNVSISCVPALHFSGRGLFDRNRTLWCGYVISSESGVIYFAGDTAFGRHLGAIREKFGTPRLSLLPIGAYEPRWFMSSIHMSPEEAIKAHRILNSGTSIAIHHGTFQLADDAIDTASRELRRRLSPTDSFLILKNGEAARIAR